MPRSGAASGSPNGPAAKASVSSRSSSSPSMSRSPRPGRSSGSSSSSCRPTCSSTQAWKRVPNRAEADGLRGIGRARSRASAVGSSCRRSTAVADSDGGRVTTISSARLARASATNLSSSTSHCCTRPISSSISWSSAASRATAGSAAAASTRAAASVRRATSSVPASTGQSIRSSLRLCGLTAPSSGGGASTSGVSLRAAIESVISWKNSDGPRGVFCSGPHQWHDTTSSLRGRVTAT